MGTMGGIIGGSALLGAGTSLFGASQQANAAQEAAAAQMSASTAGQQQLSQYLSQSLSATQPFRDIGQAAGYRLSSLLGLSPQYTDPRIAKQRELQVAQQQLADLNASYGQPGGGANAPLLSGPLASERRQQIMIGQTAPLNQKISQLQAELDAMPADSGQGGQAQAAAPQFGLTPIYDFQKSMLDRNLGRAQAARGLFMSGPGLEQSWFGDQALQSEDINRQLNSLQNVFNVGANAGGQQANLLSTGGQSLADLIQAGGLATAAGTAGQANAISGGAAGVSNALTGATGLFLQNQQANNLLSLLSRSQPGFYGSNIPFQEQTVAQQAGLNTGPQSSGTFGNLPQLTQRDFLWPDPR